LTWFQPPQLRVGEGIAEETRHATWLELFYDLIYVVAIAQLGEKLSEDLSFSGFIGFVLLFIPVWWAWIGTTFYANRFDVDDVGHRILTAIQMLAIAALSINIHDGLNSSAVGFALSYVVIRLMLVFQYARVVRHLPPAKDLARWYAIGFTIAALLWFASVFIPAPLRFGFWIAGIAIDFLTPLTARHLQVRSLPHLEHLPERFGLFVIIALGESAVAVVNGVVKQAWAIPSVLTAVFGFAIAFSLWWVYFENVGSPALQSAGAKGQVNLIQLWLYGHLPLIIGITATGIAVKKAILSASEPSLSDPKRWLLCGSVALCLIALAILHRTGVIFRCKARSRYRLGAALILLGLASIDLKLPPVVLIGIVAGVAIAQIFQDTYQGHPEGWKKMRLPAMGD
jgi:low temperature requirement protein LtrA